jgi:hypothetical protein
MHGLFERSILRPVGIRAYRCDGCDERFLRFSGFRRVPDPVRTNRGKET